MAAEAKEEVAETPIVSGSRRRQWGKIVEAESVERAQMWSRQSVKGLSDGGEYLIVMR